MNEKHSEEVKSHIDSTSNESQNAEKGFWFADWSFPIFVSLISAGVFAGTHMYYVYHVGAFNEVAVIALLQAGIAGGGFGAAAAFGTSFLFARILEGSLVGILDLGGSILTGLGVGIPALMLAVNFKLPLENFPLALITGSILGLVVGYIIIGIRKFTVGSSNSTFGADVMMGAGNLSGKFLGPLIVLSACSASIPIGFGSITGAAIFYFWKKPVAGGAILGAMVLGIFFPIGIK
ncbi:DUF4310 family protein [Sporolactobacillus inulinus]|uniref:DUF4310 family protein n=1 Tax=Sporolactobacillus inulinus TaxID=2078 RepID=UPI001143F214|nr:DUF4310 family protein [Sporolactobacillus inulinus]